MKRTGLNPELTPRELRHSFVSLLSDHGIPLGTIARLVGHSSRATTEAVYRKQLRPVIMKEAEAMDDIFAEDQEEGEAVARLNSFGPLFGLPGMKEAHSRSCEWASDQCRGGGM